MNHESTTPRRSSHRGPHVENLSQTPPERKSSASEEPSRNWFSAHLFVEPVEEGYRGDRVLTEAVDKWLEDCRHETRITRHFFIRYGELGSHIRLRIEGEDGSVLDWARDLISRSARLSSSLDSDEFGVYQKSNHDLISHVRFIDYEPELTRYGGRQAVEVAESLFHLSSETCLHLLKLDSTGDPALRRAFGLLAILTLIQAMADGDEEYEADLAAAYRDFGWDIHQYGSRATAGAREPEAAWRASFEGGYSRQSDELIHQVGELRTRLSESRGQGPEPFRGYHDGLKSARQSLGRLWRRGLLGPGLRRSPALPESWEQRLLTLSSSYLHMTSNRLGLSALDEAYLAEMARRIVADQVPKS
ncbi:MAG: thiopeptide-type bacteriocin biosynthesis protein [Acidobacteriota bacterium]